MIQRPIFHIGAKLEVDVQGVEKARLLGTVNWVSNVSKGVPGTIGVTLEPTVFWATTATNLPIGSPRSSVREAQVVLPGASVAVETLLKVRSWVTMLFNNKKFKCRHFVFFFVYLYQLTVNIANIEHVNTKISWPPISFFIHRIPKSGAFW